MTETYCGKSCAQCVHKEALACPGCKDGPGRQYGGDCDIAKCVRSKGHEHCGTCAFHTTCNPRRGRDGMPACRRKKMEAESQRRAAIAKRAPVLGKWLWILFWLIVPNGIAGVLSYEFTKEAVPGLYLPGRILQAMVSVSYCVILMKLSGEEPRYRRAGICALIGYGISFAALSGGAQVSGWALAVTIPGAIVSLVGEYNEYFAHAAVLTGIDYKLSEKWEKLWGWYLGMLGGMLGSLLILFLIPMLGILVFLGTAIGVIAVCVLKLVYLYRTAKIFREYPLGEG